MLIEPTPQDLHRDRNTPATVLVAVDRIARVRKPERDEKLFEAAALSALREAREAGYAAIRFVSVAELILEEEPRRCLRYQYAFNFATVKSESAS
ncbi:hypothetical protein Leucomu_03555 [Leucobacter muris]|uniref:Uncharacterized protein n=1 Tax=Leucobacter muris TaxID=1935379 RepID=A0ABX5QDL7_9MICO|nr:hypothetical protein [Leucobacter muris]QAB17118.1 hypothetical protein Leucomu_03555 [Leucobacter muris]